MIHLLFGCEFGLLPVNVAAAQRANLSVRNLRFQPLLKSINAITFPSDVLPPCGGDVSAPLLPASLQRVQDYTCFPA